MFNGDFDNSFWDEHKWEAHLNEIEKKTTDMRQLTASNNLPRWLLLLKENNDELDAIDAFIEEELQIDETYFPRDDNEDLDDDWDEDWDEYFTDEFEEDFFLEDEEDFDAGEEWKELSEDFAMSEHGSIDSLAIYNSSRELAAIVLQWAEQINPRKLTTEYNEFVSSVLTISAKIAGGYSFGFDPSFLGANIAYTKKALYSANNALAILRRDLKETPFISKKQYFNFHELLFSLRNNIGIYIQELREKFYNNL